jgi:DNA-binding NtrC family response regulator
VATILLVDDDVDLVEMYRVVLDHRGHTVWPAYSAADASKALEKDVPDIVVLDVMMESDTAGFNLAREIHERHPALPVVMRASRGGLNRTRRGFRCLSSWTSLFVRRRWRRKSRGF